MSIKDNVKYIKKELSADEQVLESALKLETLYNKHKYKIWAVLVIIVLSFVGKVILDTVQEARLESASQAFSILQKDPNNSEAIEVLRSKNHALYELYSYAEAVKSKDPKQLDALTSSKNPLIADVSRYSKQVLESKSSDSVYYKEMSLIGDAYIALKAGKNKEAKEKLELIDARSPVAPVADLLKHYSIKG
ncbi:MAG: hypothetical protein DRG30_02495 [Epsilonproteobacteria bacterium]|nr:MAG: hypothetical protein DRG30_02495 [Campylobacterota bacterium]